MIQSKRDLIFQSEDKAFSLQISYDKMELMRNTCKKSFPNETGGILIGHYSEDCKVAIVTQILGPPRGSSHFKSSFVRCGKSLLPILDKLWKKNQYYLGEWHFHPSASPNPSSTDLSTMKNLSKTKELHCPEPIMIIIGGNADAWSEYAMLIYQDKPIKLNRV